MIRRSDFTASDANGTPEPGVYITVKDENGDLATLFNDDGLSLSNPFQSGTLGSFVYNVATEGVYTEEYRLSLSDSPRKIIKLELSLSGEEGLFAQAPSLIVPIGTNMVSTTGQFVIGTGAANYIYDAAVDTAYVAANQRSSFISANGRGFRLDHEQDFTPEMFRGALDADWGNAFVAALAFLKAFNLNSAGGAYKGSPKLTLPGAPEYYLGTTTLDINHSLMIEGQGAEKAPHPAYGPTHLRWANGVCGIRVQFPSTSGTSTVDSGHDGAGAVYLRNFSMEGGYTSGAGDGISHGLVVRAITYLDNILVRNWGGTGVLTWTGIVNGTNYSGNTSVSRYTGVKVEGCKVAFDTRGTDSNVITFIGCEAYQCRQAGFVDFNGAGSNTYIGAHATYNGAVGGVGIYTQVSYSGKRYAVVWGQEAGAATNAPSGTAADNTWWLYAGVGGVDALHPAWVSGMSGLLAGGDYITLSAYPTILINCYVEGGGGLSQLSTGTLTLGGTNLGISSAGGSSLVPEYDGLALKRPHGSANLHLDGSDGGSNGIDSRDSTGAVGSLTWSSNNCAYIAGVGGGHRFYTFTAGVATYRGSIMYYGIDLPTGEAYYVNSLQVLGARKTGWAISTGTATRTAFDTTTVTLPQLAERVKALIDDLHSAGGHGMIGT